jgi:ankyrin repeat protein
MEALTEQLQANPQWPADHLISGIISGQKRQHLELILHYQPDIVNRLLLDPTAWWDETTMPSADDARWLFESGLHPQRRNWLGITLLHRCAAKGDIAIASVCLEYGCDINALETEWSSTPVGWAVRKGQLEMADWLLEKGADPQLPADEPWAHPIAWATRSGRQDLIDLLNQY